MCEGVLWSAEEFICIECWGGARQYIRGFNERVVGEGGCRYYMRGENKNVFGVNSV